MTLHRSNKVAGFLKSPQWPYTAKVAGFFGSPQWTLLDVRSRPPRPFSLLPVCLLPSPSPPPASILLCLSLLLLYFFPFYISSSPSLHHYLHWFFSSSSFFFRIIFSSSSSSIEPIHPFPPLCSSFSYSLFSTSFSSLSFSFSFFSTSFSFSSPASSHLHTFFPPTPFLSPLSSCNPLVPLPTLPLPPSLRPLSILLLYILYLSSSIYLSMRERERGGVEQITVTLEINIQHHHQHAEPCYRWRPSTIYTIHRWFTVSSETDDLHQRQGGPQGCPRRGKHGILHQTWQKWVLCVFVTGYLYFRLSTELNWDDEK